MAMLIALVFAGCGSKKNTTTSNVQNSSNSPFGEFYEMPCVDASMDDDNYFRGLGVGTNINLQNARTAAMQSARQMLLERLGGFVQGLSSDYARTISGQAPADKVQRALEDGFDKLVEKMVNDAQKTCEKFSKLGTGEFQSYIAIQIPKKQMMDNMLNTVSESEELEIEFNRDQFRKYAEKRMADMKAAQEKEKH